MSWNPLRQSLRQVRRLFIALIGFTVLAIGLAMTVLPGPAILVIPLGLALLATEFVWAKKTLHQLKEQTQRLKAKLRNNSKATNSASQEGGFEVGPR